MTEYSTEKYRGYDIKICYDESPENTRNFDNVSTFVCEHRRYTLGDSQDIAESVNYLFDKYVAPKDTINYFLRSRRAEVVQIDEGDGSKMYYHYQTKCGDKTQDNHLPADQSLSDAEIAGHISEKLLLEEKLNLAQGTGEVVWTPISMYEHSGITVWLGPKSLMPDSQWDCSSIGFAYVEKCKAEQEGMIDPGEKYNNDWKKWAHDIMKSEMRLYDMYLRGEVFGYYITNGEDDFEDSCFGFYGHESHPEMVNECKDIIDLHIKEAMNKRKLDLEILTENIGCIVGRMFTKGNTIYKINKDIFGRIVFRSACIKSCVVQGFSYITNLELPNDILDKMVGEIKRLQEADKQVE